MSYDVKYTGELTIEPPLNETERKALGVFLKARHVKTVNGPLDIRRSLHKGHKDVVDWNVPAEGVPGLYSHLQLSEDGSTLFWDGSEGASNMAAWVQMLIEGFLKPGGVFEETARQVEGNALHGFTFDHMVNGEMEAAGPEGDAWMIRVQDNEVSHVTPTFTPNVEMDDDDDE